MTIDAATKEKMRAEALAAINTSSGDRQTEQSLREDTPSPGLLRVADVALVAKEECNNNNNNNNSNTQQTNKHHTFLARKDKILAFIEKEAKTDNEISEGIELSPAEVRTYRGRLGELVERANEERPYRYCASAKGIIHLEKLREEAKSRSQDREERLERPQRLLEQAKRILNPLLNDAREKNGFILTEEIIDSEPELAELLREDAREGLRFLTAASQVVAGERLDIQLVPSKIPSHRSAREVSEDEGRGLVCLEGVPLTLAPMRSRTVSIKFECPACGAHIPFLVKPEELRPEYPKRCACGRKGDFKEVYRETEALLEFTLEDRPERLGGETPGRTRAFARGRVAEVNASALATLKPFRFYGSFVNIKDPSRPAVADRVFDIYGISEVVPRPEDFQASEEILSLADRAQQAEDPLAATRELAFDGAVLGLEHAKDALLLSASSGREEGEPVHVFIFGPAGTGKSLVASETLKLVPRSEFAQGRAATRAGLVASSAHDQITGQRYVKLGLLPTKDLVHIDEIGRLSQEVHESLLPVLGNGRYSLATAESQASGSAPARVIATDNPSGPDEDFVSGIEARAQTRLPLTLVDRFFLVPVVRSKVRARDLLDAEEKRLLPNRSNLRAAQLIIYRASLLKPRLDSEAKDRLAILIDKVIAPNPGVYGPSFRAQVVARKLLLAICRIGGVEVPGLREFRVLERVLRDNASAHQAVKVGSGVLS